MWKIFRIIWDGPFYIGLLTRPISVGDVLIKVLETLWRAAVAVIALVAVLAGAVAAWSLVLEPKFFPPLAKRVLATAIYSVEAPPPRINLVPPNSDETGTVEAQADRQAQSDFENFHCSPEYPILVNFFNSSSKAIIETHFSINAFSRGRSSKVSRYNSFSSDAVIPPETANKSCWKIPLNTDFDPQNLYYEVEITSAKAG